MSFWIWFATGSLITGALLAAFILIARKGRALRISQPLPPEATKAFLSWSENGHARQREINCPFYLGKSAESDIHIPDARSDYEICIFYHNHRFAMQTLPGAAEVRLNDEEVIAGYLRDGDTLRIANRAFTFRCW